MRIARGVTGKDKVLFCGYHGWHDWYLAANIGEGCLDSHLFPGIDPLGVPSCLEGTAIPFAYGDLDMLEELLMRSGDEVAAIIMEPMRSQLPPKGYLEGVRELATKYNVLLIFDEVTSGFRVALGGVQEYTGVVPDLSVFAKAISNGYPMGVVVGKRDYMKAAERMFISSAYWDDAIGIVAALTTIKELKRRNAVDYFSQLGASFRERINLAAKDVGLEAECQGLAAHPTIHIHTEDSEAAKKVTTLFIQENARRGVILPTGIFFNCSHDDEALDRTERVVRETFSVIKKGITEDRLDELLECDIQEDLFRRLVN